MNTKLMIRLSLKLSLAVLLTTAITTHAQTRLLPFQGRLTEANGAPVPDGARVVQFKLYNAAVGGQALWNGEVHKLSVNGGLVNTILGSKASLAAVDFNQNVYLELTIDANGDDQIDLADPPLLPRQSILPAVFSSEAAEARKLAGFDWGDLMVGRTNNPATGWVRGDRVEPLGITAVQIAAQAVQTAKIANGAVTAEKLSPQMQMDSVIPTGTIMPYLGDTSPSGWLLCNGAAVSRTTHARLFGIIGTRCGAGDGSATFNLPDFRGRFLRGRDGGAGRDPDALNRVAMADTNSVVGDQPGSVQDDEFKSHDHSAAAHPGGNHDHDHKSGPLHVQNVWGAAPNLLANGGAPGTVTYTFNDGEIYHHAITAQPPGGPSRVASLGIMESGNLVEARGGSETRPQNASVNFIIKH